MGNGGIFAVTFHPQISWEGTVHQQEDETVYVCLNPPTHSPIIYIHYTQAHVPAHASQPFSSLSPCIEIEIAIHSFLIGISVNGLRCWNGGGHNVPSVKGNELSLQKLPLLLRSDGMIQTCGE